MLQSLFDQEALLFTVPALLGTAVFLIRLGLMTIVGLDHDVDVPHDVDIPHDVAVDMQGDVDLGHDVESGDSTEAFKLLSIFEWSFPMSLLLGVGFGLVLVWLLGILMKAMYDLQSSGNVRVEDAVGAEGQVYANVPASAGGRGQVRVVISDRARIYNAVSDGDAIKTGSRVRVVRVNEDRTLTVTAV
ncbi:MAG: hypothetical protein ACYTGM_16430 [Planctomycetota bacterium]|jgi:membrane protein implicated in regulation of membrane protease activity